MKGKSPRSFVHNLQSAGVARSLLLLLALLFLFMGQIEGAAAAGNRPVEGEQYSYYTERYWQAAVRQEAAAEAEQYAYYTERYWNAAARSAGSAERTATSN